jgi:YHS domain-containing protein
MLKDPVCGKRMNRNKAHIVIEYEGVNYFLCCRQCQAEFERTPKVYARPGLGVKVRKGNRRPQRQLQH